MNLLEIGDHSLDTSDFEGAIEAYQKVIEKDDQEPEGYWGLALAKQKVRYIKDEVNNRLQPICYEINKKSFIESEEYQKAISLSTPSQQIEYQKRAKEIEYIKEEFNRLKESGYDYDCFICVKVTGKNNEKTEDSKDAHYIYELLKGKGYKPFYSEVSIRNKTGEDYEEAVKWYKDAAKNGNTDTQVDLGLCYESGNGVEQDFEEADSWFLKAADQDNKNAQQQLRECYEKGIGVTRNLDESRKWYEIARRD